MHRNVTGTGPKPLSSDMKVPKVDVLYLGILTTRILHSQDSKARSPDRSTPPCCKGSQNLKSEGKWLHVSFMSSALSPKTLNPKPLNLYPNSPTRVYSNSRPNSRPAFGLGSFKEKAESGVLSCSCKLVSVLRVSGWGSEALGLFTAWVSSPGAGIWA